MPLLDQWERDDLGDDSGRDERGLPYLSRCTGADGLDPQPPAGWWATLRYDTRPPVCTRDVAIWFAAVQTAQDASKKAGRKLHMISREADGCRILSVHPDLSTEADNIVEEASDHLTGYASNCGGYTTIYPDLQRRAAIVLLRRMWSRVPFSSVLGLLLDLGLDPALAMTGDTGWLDDVREVGDLQILIEETEEAASSHGPPH